MKALDAMLPANAGERRTLADIIFAKLDNLESGNTDIPQQKRHGQLLPHSLKDTMLNALRQTLTAYPTPLLVLIPEWWKCTQSIVSSSMTPVYSYHHP